MNFDLNSHTIHLVLSGSRAYGINTETSDWDYRGVGIAPLEYYFSYSTRWEQSVDSGTKSLYKQFPGEVVVEADMQIMELAKFCHLAAQCNPSVIEILFTDPKFYVRDPHPVMQKIIDNRDLFLSKQAKARFMGYALQQLQKIKRHKRWLDASVPTMPNREDFGLPPYKLISTDQFGAAESLIKKEINEFVVDQTHLPEDVKIELGHQMSKMMKAIWSALHTEEYPIGKGKRFERTDDALMENAARDQGFNENFIEILRRERQYRAAKQEYDHYQTWVKERNPARAELEKKYGFDCKFAVHLVRLTKIAREIIETGKVLVHRPDAEELKAIRNGAWTYEQILEFAEKENKLLEEAVKTSKLPKVPPLDQINKLVFDAIMEFNHE